MARVTDVWSENVQGIKFQPKTTMGLRTNLNFCRDTWSTNLLKWRQVVAAGSPGLHIIAPNSGLYEAHIDRISPIQGREPGGDCIRKYFPEGIHHLFHEKLGWSRSSLLLGVSGGLTSVDGEEKGFIGLDVGFAYRFLSLLGNRLHVKGMLRGEWSNLFTSISGGIGVEANYKRFSGLVSGHGVVGKLPPEKLAGRGEKLGAGITTGAGAFLNLDNIALQLGVEYHYVKDLVNKDPELHRLMVSARIKLW